MADLLAANVTVVESWTTGGTTGKRNKVRTVKWTGTTAGSATNQLLATALGFTKILRTSNVLLNAATPLVYPAVVAVDGSAIYLINPNTVTDADRGKLYDLATSTDYAYATIEGV